MKDTEEPLSPIFHYLLKTWREVEIENEEKWKLWEFSAPEPETEDEPSKKPPQQQKKKIVTEREVKEDEVDYGGQDEYSVSDAPQEESGEEERQIKQEERQFKQQDDDDRSYEEPTWQWSPNSESQDEARPKRKVKAKAKFMPTNRERPIVRLTENNLPNDGDNDWNLQSWKKQRRGPATESVTPEEIYRAAAAAWSRFRGKLEYIESNDIPKSFTRQHDRRFFNLGHMVEDLKFEHDFYCPKPKIVNGEPLWEKVVPYNACYLPNHDDRIDHRELNPVEMWLEARWILTRSIYGSELTQKLFMQCWNRIYACNDIKGYYFHQIQDAIVS